MIPSPWPGLKVYAEEAGEIDPYDPANIHLFRGEEAFAPDVTGPKRWSKPSPEPEPGPEFEGLLLGAISRERPTVLGMVERLADNVAEAHPDPPLLVAILRAGVPVSALLARTLTRRYGEAVPTAALSLFDGLGWDALALEAALEAALRDHPHRRVLFVDGWTSGGGVARELRRSHERWLRSGHPDFTHGKGPRLAVLCDHRGLAAFSAVRRDAFVPSCLFTAPETLGFSRGFAADGGAGMFRVYRFPERLLRPDYLAAWMEEDEPIPVPEEPFVPPPPAPPGWRVHVNEVVRALINRSPREVFFRDEEADVRERLAPVLYLCALRGVPASFGRKEAGELGAVAVARMEG